MIPKLLSFTCSLTWIIIIIASTHYTTSQHHFSPTSPPISPELHLHASTSHPTQTSFLPDSPIPFALQTIPLFTLKFNPQNVLVGNFYNDVSIDIAGFQILNGMIIKIHFDNIQNYDPIIQSIPHACVSNDLDLIGNTTPSNSEVLPFIIIKFNENVELLHAKNALFPITCKSLLLLTQETEIKDLSFTVTQYTSSQTSTPLTKLYFGQPVNFIRYQPTLEIQYGMRNRQDFLNFITFKLTSKYPAWFHLRFWDETSQQYENIGISYTKTRSNTVCHDNVPDPTRLPKYDDNGLPKNDFKIYDSIPLYPPLLIESFLRDSKPIASTASSELTQVDPTNETAPIISSSFFLSFKHERQITPFSVFGEDLTSNENLVAYCSIPFRTKLPSHLELCTIFNTDCFRVPTLNLSNDLTALASIPYVSGSYEGKSIVHRGYIQLRPSPSFLSTTYIPQNPSIDPDLVRDTQFIELQKVIVPFANLYPHPLILSSMPEAYFEIFDPRRLRLPTSFDSKLSLVTAICSKSIFDAICASDLTVFDTSTLTPKQICPIAPNFFLYDVQYPPILVKYWKYRLAIIEYLLNPSGMNLSSVTNIILSNLANHSNSSSLFEAFETENLHDFLFIFSTQTGLTFVPQILSDDLTNQMCLLSTDHRSIPQCDASLSHLSSSKMPLISTNSPLSPQTITNNVLSTHLKHRDVSLVNKPIISLSTHSEIIPNNSTYKRKLNLSQNGSNFQQKQFEEHLQRQRQQQQSTVSQHNGSNKNQTLPPMTMTIFPALNITINNKKNSTIQETQMQKIISRVTYGNLDFTVPIALSSTFDMVRFSFFMELEPNSNSIITLTFLPNESNAIFFNTVDIVSMILPHNSWAYQAFYDSTKSYINIYPGALSPNHVYMIFFQFTPLFPFTTETNVEITLNSNIVFPTFALAPIDFLSYVEPTYPQFTLYSTGLSFIERETFILYRLQPNASYIASDFEYLTAFSGKSPPGLSVTFSLRSILPLRGLALLFDFPNSSIDSYPDKCTGRSNGITHSLSMVPCSSLGVLHREYRSHCTSALILSRDAASNSETALNTIQVNCMFTVPRYYRFQTPNENQNITVYLLDVYSNSFTTFSTFPSHLSQFHTEIEHFEQDSIDSPEWDQFSTQSSYPWKTNRIWLNGALIPFTNGDINPFSNIIRDPTMVENTNGFPLIQSKIADETRADNVQMPSLTFLKTKQQFQQVSSKIPDFNTNLLGSFPSQFLSDDGGFDPELLSIHDKFSTKILASLLPYSSALPNIHLVMWFEFNIYKHPITQQWVIHRSNIDTPLTLSSAILIIDDIMEAINELRQSEGQPLFEDLDTSLEPLVSLYSFQIRPRSNQKVKFTPLNGTTINSIALLRLGLIMRAHPFWLGDPKETRVLLQVSSNQNTLDNFTQNHIDTKLINFVWFTGIMRRMGYSLFSTQVWFEYYTPSLSPQYPNGLLSNCDPYARLSFSAIQSFFTGVMVKKKYFANGLPYPLPNDVVDVLGGRFCQIDVQPDFACISSRDCTMQHECIYPTDPVELSSAFDLQMGRCKPTSYTQLTSYYDPQQYNPNYAWQCISKATAQLGPCQPEQCDGICGTCTTLFERVVCIDMKTNEWKLDSNCDIRYKPDLIYRVELSCCPGVSYGPDCSLLPSLANLQIIQRQYYSQPVIAPTAPFIGDIIPSNQQPIIEDIIIPSSNSTYVPVTLNSNDHIIITWDWAGGGLAQGRAHIETTDGSYPVQIDPPVLLQSGRAVVALNLPGGKIRSVAVRLQVVGVSEDHDYHNISALTQQFSINPRCFDNAGFDLCTNGQCNTILGTCDCSLGYSGEYCEISLCASVCYPRGTASCNPDPADPNRPQCICKPFWGRFDCGQYELCALSMSAKNIRTDDSSNSSLDPVSVTTPNIIPSTDVLSEKKIVSSSTCVNGSFRETSPGLCSSACICDDFFSGPNCDTCSLACNAKNSPLIIRGIPDQYCRQCNCKPGYSGSACQCKVVYGSIVFFGNSNLFEFSSLYVPRNIQPIVSPESIHIPIISFPNQSISPSQPSQPTLSSKYNTTITAETQFEFLHWKADFLSNLSTALQYPVENLNIHNIRPIGDDPSLNYPLILDHLLAIPDLWNATTVPPSAILVTIAIHVDCYSPEKYFDNTLAPFEKLFRTETSTIELHNAYNRWATFAFISNRVLRGDTDFQIHLNITAASAESNHNQSFPSLFPKSMLPITYPLVLDDTYSPFSVISNIRTFWSSIPSTFPPRPLSVLPLYDPNCSFSWFFNSTLIECPPGFNSLSFSSSSLSHFPPKFVLSLLLIPFFMSIL